MRPGKQWSQTKTIGDVAKVISGYAFKSDNFGAEGVPVIKIKNIRVGSVDLTDAEYVNSSFLSILAKYHVKHGDLLLSLTGSHLTQPNSVVGRVALFPRTLPPCLLNQRAGKVFVTKPDQCDVKFLYYLLSTNDMRRELALMASGAASQANISPSQVESLKVVLPPLYVQRKVSSILSAYDDLIENNTRRIKILEDMAQMLYREWFVDFRFPGHEQSKMVEAKSGPMPEGWQTKKLSSCVSIHKGKKSVSILAENADGLVPYLLIESIKNGGFQYVSPSKLVMAQQKDTIMVMDGASSGLVTIGAAGAVGSTLAAIRTTDANLVSPYLLFHFLVDNQREILMNNTGSAIPHANKDFINGMLIPVPKGSLNKDFDSVAGQVHNLIAALKTKNRNLRQTRDLLLPKLISGEMDVSDLKIS